MLQQHLGPAVDIVGGYSGLFFMGPEVQCADVLSGATCSPSSLGVAATSGAPADTSSIWNPVWIFVASFWVNQYNVQICFIWGRLILPASGIQCGYLWPLFWVDQSDVQICSLLVAPFEAG